MLIDKQETKATGPTQAETQGEEPKGKKNEGEPKPPRKGARAKVKKAQFAVLEKLDQIVEGNCQSAITGNPGCAKFMLDWSGVSDLRAPLAPAPKQKTLEGTLLKKLKAIQKNANTGSEKPQEK